MYPWATLCQTVDFIPQSWALDLVSRVRPLPEFIDPVFAKTRSINSGTGEACASDCGKAAKEKKEIT